jgi:spore germination cell wall hydrolase CwlJ-like protein
MRRTALGGWLASLLVILGGSMLPGCTGRAPTPERETVSLTGSAAERICLVRAMYFESNRSSRDGLMAVGTVVMNRVASPRYPNTICGVVGEHRQFAAGVLTRPLDPRQLPPVERAADAVLAGERYAPIGDAMFFHVAGLKIPYRVEYMAVAGGNAFYHKTGRRFTGKPLLGERPTVDVAAAPSPAGTSSAANAAPAPGWIERLYERALASGGQGPKPCETATSAFGTTSACEDETTGR